MKSLIIASALGLVLGFSARQISNREERQLDTRDPALHVGGDTNPVEAPHSTMPRPTFEEVCQARGEEAVTLALRYLQDATIEEVIALMDEAMKEARPGVSAFPQEDISIANLRGIAQFRGLELDAPRMLEWLKSLDHPYHHINAFYQQWSMIDPEAAIRASMNELSQVRQTMMQSLRGADLDRAITAMKKMRPDLSEWRDLERLKWTELGKQDPRAALDQARDIMDPAERKLSTDTVIEGWITTDPLAALQWMETSGNIEGGTRLVENAIDKLSATQPVLAQQKIELLPNSQNRAKLEGTVVKRWAEQDAEEAIEWVKSLPKGPRRDGLVSSITGTLEWEPEKLLELVADLNVDVHQSDSVGALEIETGGYYPMRNSGSTYLKHTVNDAIRALADESPKDAFSAMYRLGSRESWSMKPIAEVWVNDDPQEAAKWAASLPESEFTASAQKAILEAWGEKDPASAVSFLTDNGLAENTEISEKLAMHWAKEDPASALTWADTLTIEERDKVFFSAIYTAATEHPVEALQFFDRISDEATQRQILETATTTWRNEDPAGVMDWLRIQPDEARIDGVLKETAKAWVLELPEAASEWIGQMEVSPRRDQAVAGLVNALISSSNPSKDFDSAGTWVQTITDPELRQQWIDEIATRR